MTEWTLTKKSVAGIGMLVIGDKEGIFARRSGLAATDTLWGDPSLSHS